MSSTSRRLSIAAAALAALGMNAGPALASSSNPVQTYLNHETPKLRQNVPAIGSRTEETRGITKLTANERESLVAIHVVERLSTPDVRGKRRWLEGQRYQVRGDVATIHALRLALTGHRTAGVAEANAQWAPQGNFSLADHWNAIGLRYLGVKAG